MPGAIKRRKLATDRHAASVKQTRGLQTFTTTSKAVSVEKSVIEKASHVETIAITSKSSTTTKRKLVDSDEESTPEQSPVSSQTSVREIRSLPSRRSNDVQSLHTPERPILSQDSATSIETPTKGARSLLDRFRISTTTPTRSPLNSSSSSPSILEVSPEKIYLDTPHDLPTELLDLINLHAAFLTALSIHYAHNGTHAPADLRNLCPDVARAWGKRTVTLEDIRRTLGILNTNIPEKYDHRISQLSLSDYGHGKICIEVKTNAGKPGRIARPVNEDLLNNIFAKGLVTTWEGKIVQKSVVAFIEDLPLQPIAICPSLIKMSPLLAKGQRRLDDLRAGMASKDTKERKLAITSTANGTKPSLLERLRAKQLHQSTLAPLPSKAELARKAALGRIDEVVAVLTILSTSNSVGQQRISFTLPTVIGKLKDSFKTPMSREEADTCVRLLAAEIAPDWVKIVKMGKIEALVVNRDERPQETDIKARVQRVI
ncbi:uncharacterized protein LY89DRAFT_103413 [Mollisia scopiformis]|uniref:DNA replication factor Cdt1 C-terminal domain-containing protein n=1 Tax=Mollisia scopiformis TaxID=149040 RepID=A0A194X7L9_MOLSC|nr:uncharacterized protein LY89DRAFT_103413 [Mollisia scopiformis]KUJ16099.1 hypothetical protein LY89DRAFT_103413 [Mollisia scopiformis]